MSGNPTPAQPSNARRFVDLEGAARDRALPPLREGFEGVYRWHAKRMLGRVTRVRAVEISGEVVAAALLDRLTLEVGYVYYLAVGERHRRSGLGGALLDDALRIFRAEGASVVYAAAESDNRPSLELFRTRGFREVARHETSYRDGGLGAWGLRSRMWVVSGEKLLGLRLTPPVATTSPVAPAPAGGRTVRASGGGTTPAGEP